MKSNVCKKRSPQIDSQPLRDASLKIEITKAKTKVTNRAKDTTLTEVICAKLRTNPSVEKTGRNRSPHPLNIAKTQKRKAKKTKSKRSQSIKMKVMMMILRDKLAS